jgi:recombination protein RecT
MGQMTVEQWYGTIKTGLTKKLTENKEALPAGFNQQRFILNCITVIQDMMKDNKKKEQLEKINPETIPVCLEKAAYLGLDFFNGECYAIPYGGNLTFQTDYKGEIKLCKRYSKNKIKDIFAKVVRQGDFFMEEVDGGKQNVQYRPKPFSNEQMIGAFAIVVFEDGSMMYDTMSSEDIENVRNTYSKMKDSQAWKSSTGEMYKKTVLRRLCKLIDLDFDNIEQQKAYEDGGDVVFNQQSLPGATTGQALLPENDKPVDAFAAIKAQKQAEPVIDGMILEEA